MSSSWATNGLWWLLTLVLYLLLDLCISSLTVSILRWRCIASLVTYRAHLLGILVFSIGSVKVFQCWNYLLFPIVGFRWSKQVLLRSYRAQFCSSCLGWSVGQWANRIFLVFPWVATMCLWCVVSMLISCPESCPEIDCVLVGNCYIANGDLRAGLFSQREGYMCGFVFINSEAPFMKPLFHRVETPLESGWSNYRVCVGS